MTETWINGGIWSGALKPYTLLLITRQNGTHNDCVQYRILCVCDFLQWNKIWFVLSGGLRNGFSILISSPFTIMFSFGMKILELRTSTLKSNIPFPSLVKLQLIKVNYYQFLKHSFYLCRYLKIVKTAGLEISQPALHPNSTEVHHRITVRSRTNVFHR